MLLHSNPSTPRRALALTLTPFGVSVSLGTLAMLGWSATRVDSEAWHATLEGATAMVAAFGACLGLRAYLGAGSLRPLALAGALGAYAAVTLSESLFTTRLTMDEFSTFGTAALVLLAVLALAAPTRAVTRARSARAQLATFVGGSLLLLAVLAIGVGVRLDPHAAADARWARADLALELGAFVVLALASANAVRAARAGEVVPGTLPVGLALLASQIALVPFAPTWSAAWWFAHFAGLAGIVALSWSAFSMALACERTEGALSAAESRSERLESLGTLVAGVAHEINNPLMYVRGNVELAMMDVEDAQRAIGARDVPGVPDLAHTAQQLAVSLEGADRIARITRSLRAVARADGGAFQPIDLASVTRSAAELITIGMPDDVTVTVDAGDRAVTINGNESELHQVILNLARNAVEALGDAGGRVTVRVTNRDRVAELTVTDTGPGIAADVKAKLFTPFFTTKPHSTGLGLSIVHTIVQEHGGEILVDSTPQTGTTFTVRFPVTAPTDVEKRLETLF